MLRTYKFIYSILVWLILHIVFGSLAGAQEIVWEQTNGPYGGTATSFFATPEGVLYAGTSAGVFRLDDNGASWIQTNAGLTNLNVRALAGLGPSIYAGTNDGVFRSDHGGSSWKQIGLTNLEVQTLAVNGSILYAGTNKGLFRSEDTGYSWTKLDIGSKRQDILSFAISGNNLYVGTSHDGLFRSKNGGISWTESTGLRGFFFTSRTVYALAFFEGVLYAGTHSGLLRSANKGTSWTKTEFINRGHCITTSFIVSGETLYAGTESGFFRLEDDGYSWTELYNTGLTNRHIESLGVLGKTLYVGTRSTGVFRYQDGEEGFWEEVNKGLTALPIRSLVASGKTLYALTDTGILCSENGGESWTQRRFTFYPVSKLLVFRDSLYALKRGVVRSEDGGKSWVKLDTGLATELRLMSLAASGEFLYVGTDKGIFRSKNGREGWIYKGLANLYVVKLAASQEVIYALTWAAGVSGSPVPNTLYSDDGGESWTQMDIGLPYRDIRSLAVSGMILYAGTKNNGVLMSESSGESWTNIGLADQVTLSFAFLGSNIYAGTQSGGVFRAQIPKWEIE